MVARRAHNPKVVGSNPAPATTFLLVKVKKLAQQSDAGWSSMVARRAHNPKVVGSNPAPATTFLLVKVKKTSATIGRGMEQYGSSSGS